MGQVNLLLFLHFNGVIKPSKGTNLLMEIEVKYDKKPLKIRQKLGIVFQNPDDQINCTHCKGGCGLWSFEYRIT